MSEGEKGDTWDIMKKSSILKRARTVLKTTGTLGSASAGQFIDNFCNEVEREAYANDGEKTVFEDWDEKPEDEEDER